MLRKHINSLNDEQFKALPFYSWQCITLQLKHRDVDLVIRDQRDMERLLKVLIHAMKTMDGRRDSAKHILSTLNRQEIQRFKYKVSDGTIKEQDKRKIIQLNEHKFYQKIMMKYKIMTIRSKISYIACLNMMTIKELIVKQIKYSYDMLIQLGHIKINKIDR